MDHELLEAHGLSQYADGLARFAQPAIAVRPLADPTGGRSRMGGRPLLARNAVWPRSAKRPLDFLLQIDLADLGAIEPAGLLPSSGLLTFFYDLQNQPWGYDPAELDGYYVMLVGDGVLEPRDPPAPPAEAIAERWLSFGQAVTLPSFGSHAFERLVQELGLDRAGEERYLAYRAAYEGRFYAAGAGQHHLFGHSANIQGDMQLEAQLVTHGIFCGDPSGYRDPRASTLAEEREAWTLLLQLDSDDTANLMWGDLGTLYFWLRRDDLHARRFDQAWVTLQCY